MNLPVPSPKSMVRFHLVMMVVWIVLAVPTILWWKDSILWVLLVSLYANFVGHFGAYGAERAGVAAEDGAVA